jgi:hypothetical chaperone protein
MPRPLPRAVGIDFGTTNTAASVLRDDGQAELIELDPSSSGDKRLLKTLLYFPNRKEAFFGHAAIEQYFERDREGRFLQSIKRLLPSPEFQGTSIHGKFASLEDLVSRFLAETRRRIEKSLGLESLSGIPIIMGRPARYSLEPGREGLAAVRFRKACELAGLENIRLVEEPVAAAFTYEPAPDQDEERVLVADLGGGTSDFTLMSVRSGAKPRVLAVNGVPVAGDALDSAFTTAKLLSYFGSEIRYRRPFSENVLTMPTSFMRLLPKWHHHAFLREKSIWEFLRGMHRELVDPAGDGPLLENLITLVDDNLGYALHQRVEAIKCELSDATRAEFSFRSHPIRIEFPVPRAEYEALLEPSVEPIRAAALDTMQQARVEPSELHAIYFSGGTSRVPRIRSAIQSLFPEARVAERDTFTSVAAGLVLS